MQDQPRGAPLARRKKRRALDEESNTPFAEEATAQMRAATRAYRCCVYGLIPGAGLVLGPLALALGLRARLAGDNGSDWRGKGLASAAMLVGGLLTLTNWLGLTLMVLGLRG
jgi:hypothetical protein